MRYSLCVLSLLACSPQRAPEPVTPCYIIGVKRNNEGHVVQLEERCGGDRIIKVKEVE